MTLKPLEFSEESANAVPDFVPAPSIIPAARPKAPRSDRLLRGLMSRRDARALTREIEDLKREWPDKLRDVGTVAQLAVATLDQKAADTSDAIFNLNKRDIARVYAELSL